MLHYAECGVSMLGGTLIIESTANRYLLKLIIQVGFDQDIRFSDFETFQPESGMMMPGTIAMEIKCSVKPCFISIS